MSVAALVGGCASGTFVPSPALVNISGDWEGKCTGSACFETYVYLTLAQTRNTVSGTFRTPSRNQYSRARPILKGLVAERKFTFEVRGDAGSIWTFDLSIAADADSMSGTSLAQGSMGMIFKRTGR